MAAKVCHMKCCHVTLFADALRICYFVRLLAPPCTLYVHMPHAINIRESCPIVWRDVNWKNKNIHLLFLFHCCAKHWVQGRRWAVNIMLSHWVCKFFCFHLIEFSIYIFMCCTPVYNTCTSVRVLQYTCIIFMFFIIQYFVFFFSSPNFFCRCLPGFRCFAYLSIYFRLHRWFGRTEFILSENHHSIA